MITMHDSVNPASIPAGTQVAAGYANGAFAWSAAGWARFPRARKVRIDVNGSAPLEASVLDVERGDATPAAAPGWIRERDGFRPGTATIYCNRSALPQVLAACDGLGFWLWLASWTGTPAAQQVSLPAGVRLAAVQYLSNDSFDLSRVYSTEWLEQHRV